MNDVKVNYDEDADVLYVSFGRSEHVTGIKLAENVLLRLDTGKETRTGPRAIGLTFISFRHMMAHIADGPLSVSLNTLRNLPDEISQAVWHVLTSAPVSDFLAIELSISPQIPPLPDRATT